MYSTFINLITIVNLLTYLFLIFIVGSKWIISKSHRRLFFIGTFTFLWILDVYLEEFVRGTDLYKFVVHFNDSLAPLIAAMVVGFAAHFPTINKKFKIWKEFLLILPLIILSFFAFTEVVVEVNSNSDYIQSNLGYIIYIVILGIYYFFIIGIIFIKKLFNSSGIKRNQLKLIIIGYFTTIILLISQNVYKNLSKDFSVDLRMLLINLSMIFSFLLVYAVLRYRFMDIRVVIRKGLIYGISLITILALYTYLALVLKSTIEESWDLNQAWTAVILIALVALGFPPLKKLVEKSIDTLFKGKKSVDLAVKEVREKVVHETDFEKLIGLVTGEVKNFLEIDDVKLFILDHQERKLVYQDDGIQETIENKNDLLKYFEKYPDVLIRDEISHLLEEKEGEFEKEYLRKAEKEMKKRKASLIMPFKTEDEVFGLLMLGERKEDKAYTVQDVKYLEGLREQVGFTLANALLYKEAMERITATAN